MEGSVDQLFLDDLEVGSTFSAGPWEMDDRRFALFSEITGDAHPIHYDDEYVRRKSAFDKRLAHGLLLVSMTALGATPMSPRLEESMIAFVGEQMTFLRPVFVGDSVHSHFTVASTEPQPERARGIARFDVRLVNQAGRSVVEGEHRYLLRMRG